MKRRFSVTPFIFPVLLVLAAPALAKPGTVEDAAAGAPVCKAELLMEGTSGDVLFEQNIHEPLPPASMIKLMVSYVVLKEMESGSAKPGDIITASAAASKIGGSQVYLKQGEQFTLQELLDAVLVQSANDAAFAIAEHLGGSAEGFVEMMKAEAEELGMKESEFHTVHGLPPAKGQAPDLVSAHDMAILSRALMQKYPKILELTGKIEVPFRNGAFIMRNHNKLLGSYPGCDGLKTGYYQQAGFCVTTTAKRNDTRLLAVLMGCKERKKRDAEAARLMSMGFSQFKTIKLVQKGTAAEAAVPVEGGAVKEVIPVVAQDAMGAVKRGQEKNVLRKSNLCKNITAPANANTPCGTMSFMIGDKEIATVPLIIPQDIPAGGITTKLWRMIGR